MVTPCAPFTAPAATATTEASSGSRTLKVTLNAPIPGSSASVNVVDKVVEFTPSGLIEVGEAEVFPAVMFGARFVNVSSSRLFA